MPKATDYLRNPS